MTLGIGDGLHLRPELAGENPDPEPTSLKGLLIALPKVAEAAQKKWSNRRLKIRSRRKSRSVNAERSLFSPGIAGNDRRAFAVNLNIEEFKGEQLRVTGDTDSP